MIGSPNGSEINVAGVEEVGPGPCGSQGGSRQRQSPTVAVVNASPDTSEMLRYALEGCHFRTVSLVPPPSSEGTARILEFLQRHAPDVLLYDIPPPYDQSWFAFARMWCQWEAETCSVVLTTTNRRRVEELATVMPVHAVIDRLYDVRELVQVVASAPACSSRS